MEALFVEGTKQIPKVVFDPVTGSLELSGRSIPEDPVDFYTPLHNWVDQYIKEAAEETVFNFNLEYFNTSSSKAILELMKKLEIIYRQGKRVVVNWHYVEDDLDMMESGEEYQSLVKVPFNLVEDDEF